jgi:eukaryotic-like serine/threonine-protein kinase
VLAMQYVGGRTWERMILEAEHLDWVTSVRIAIDVLRALEYAHGRGVVHRDMKPSNVLVRDDDGSATVMDFGIAKMTTSTRLTATGQTMGTVRYMSPEQVRGQEVDLRTDIYSLGATLYESLVGDTPFDGDTHFEIMTKHLNEPPRPPTVRGIPIPAELEAALMRSLAKRADDRFASARDFRKALEHVSKDADVGHAETLRMSRDAVAAARTASGGQARAAAAPAPTAKVVAPAAASAAERPAALADALEPSDRSRRVPKRGRPWLLIGLAGAVAIAGAAVLVVTMTGGKGAAPGKRPPAASGASGPFLPAEVTWSVSKSFPDRGLEVRCAEACDADAIAALHDEAVSRFRAFAARRHQGATVAAQPLTVLVVSQRVLCDDRTYETRHAPANCAGEGSYYRPLERTLLVVDDAAHLRSNLSSGIAEAICVHQPIASVCDAIDAFAAESASAQSKGGPH